MTRGSVLCLPAQDEQAETLQSLRSTQSVESSLVGSKATNLEEEAKAQTETTQSQVLVGPRLRPVPHPSPATYSTPVNCQLK